MNRDNLRTQFVSYPNQSLDTALEAASNQQLLVESVVVNNLGEATNKMAIGHSVNDSQWKLFSVGSTNQDLTADIQAGLLTEVVTTTVSDGFMVCCKNTFSMLALDVAAEAVGSAFDYEYWNGSGWVALQMLYTTHLLGSGKQAIIFSPPTDWVVGSEGDGDDSMYSIRIVASSASSQAVELNALKVCKLLSFSHKVYSGGSLELQLSGKKQLLLQQGEGIIPFFAYPESNNIIEIAYQISP